MLQLQLFIEGQQVELYKDESITLTQSIQDIKDISKIFTDFTKTFNVPASKINNKIFKHFHNFNVRSYNSDTGVFESYDARKKKSAELFLNYKPFKEGNIKFEGVTLKNNEPHTYKLTFFGNILNLKDILKEDALSNLSQLSFFNFDYNDTNIKTFMTDGKNVDFFGETIDDSIIFPLITHSGRIIYDTTLTNDVPNKIYNANTNAGATSDYGLPLSELKPAIRVYAILKAIENEPEYNLKFSDDFFNKTNADFYNLYLWLHNKEGALFQDQDAQYQITGFNNVIGDVGRITGVTNKTFINDYDESDEDRVLRVNVRPSGTAAYNLVIKKNGEEFKRFDNLTGTTTNGITNFKNEDILIPNGVYTFFIETIANSTYEVDISVQVKKNGIFTRNFEITIRNASASFQTDKTVNISSIIPDMKIIDFLTGLFKMFNLTAFQNTDGIIVVQPLDDFYSSSTQVWDITKHLDKNQTTVDSVLPFKDITFKYKDTGSFLANNHKQISNSNWGELNYKSTEKYDGKNYLVEIPFGHFKYEHLYVTDNGVTQTTTTPSGNQEKTDSTVQYGYSVDKNQEPYLGDPLIFYRADSFTSVGVLNLDLQTNQSVLAPYMPLNSNGTLNVFGTSIYQNLNFNEEYDEYSRQVNEKTLFKKYYENYVKDMFDVRKRLTTVKAYLPLEITIKLNLADKIIVFDDIYRINKISTNFETNLSTIELNNIFEEVTYKTLVPVAQNCLRADTINYRASNGSFRASGNCETQFSIPDTSTPVPNDIPTNDPAPVYDGVPLSLTAPGIKASQITVPTSTSVFFNYEIVSFGKLGDTEQIDEYGFFYSDDISLLQKDPNFSANSPKDVDVLKATSGVTNVPFLTTSFFTVPKLVEYEKTGLTHPKTYYYVFYARTNTDPSHSTADKVSNIITVSTVAAPVNQYKNTTGEFLSSLVTSDLTGTGQWDFFTMATGYLTYSSANDTPDLNGVNNAFRITNIMGGVPLAAHKEFVKWFASVPDPVKGTWYPITHTWKWYDRQGRDGYFNMGDVSDAEIKWDQSPTGRLVIYIKGGTVTGSRFGSGSINIESFVPGRTDIESTSG